MNRIRDFDPTKGQAFQGDVAIVAVPLDIKIDESDEIAPLNGRLILQEGEVTGHHHAIHFERARNFRTATAETSYADALSGASPGLRTKLAPKAKAERQPEIKAGDARMFRDRTAAEAMVRAGILERADLCVGFLRVDGGSVVVRHEEHDGIRLPAGKYYVGRQVESVGAEERRVAD